MGAINESVYDWDIARNRFFTAGSMQRLLGVPRSRLTLAGWQKSIHPEDYPRFREATIAHFKGLTERFVCDYRYRAGDGTWRWARTHGLAIRDKRGRALRMVGSTGDITALKMTEEALRRSEERYAFATRAATEGIYEWNVQTGELFLSDRAREVFDFPARPLRSTDWLSLVHPEDRERYRQAVVEHFKGRTAAIECEYRVRDRRGSYRWVLDRGQAQRASDGRAIRLIGAETDITERKRTEAELREALRQQTATAAILASLSNSVIDARPVFDAIVQHAQRLFGTQFVGLFLVADQNIELVAYTHEPGFAGITSFYPRPLNDQTIVGESMLKREVLQLAPIIGNPRSPPGTVEYALRFGYNAIIAVPLMRDGKVVGGIGAARREPVAFSEQQISLIRTFADQAVIAIENARLFNETREALEHQRASAEVLHAISGSLSDTQPVFDKILDSCERLFAGRIVGLNVVRDDGMLHIGAFHGTHRAEFERIFPLPLTPESASGLAITERRVVHYPDAQNGADVPVRTRRGCKAIGIKSAIFAPVLWEGRGLGAIFVGRDHISSFSEKEIALLRTFADQAAIAIENVRLFNETKEALERQTATAEILAVISGSPTDTQPVFDAIVQGGLKLFADAAISVALPNGDEVRAAAVAESDPARAAAWRRRFPFPLTREYMHGVAILDRKVVDIPDVRHAPPEMAAGASNFLASGYRGITIMPMMRGEEAIGALSVVRVAPGPLTDRQLAVLKTFADQAVIAIENVRLFNEIREKSAALESASRHKSEFLANMSHELRTPLNAIIGFTRIVMRRSQEALEPKQYENLEKILASGQHLLALINAILDLSKIEAGRLEVAPAETPLAPVLEQCLRTVEPLAKVELLKDFDGALPHMYVDEEKLRQIVINLLSNAAKFTEQGAIRLQARVANGSVAIAVVDTGIGIPPDKLGLIFEEFEQLDARSTRAHGGTGLGLAIARRLARVMGGDIGVESALGKGSTFTLSLPLRYHA